MNKLEKLKGLNLKVQEQNGRKYIILNLSDGISFGSPMVAGDIDLLECYSAVVALHPFENPRAVIEQLKELEESVSTIISISSKLLEVALEVKKLDVGINCNLPILASMVKIIQSDIRALEI